MKYVWALVGLLYGLLNLYVGFLFLTAGIGARLLQKGVYLQAPPILGGIALFVLAVPLIWNCIQLATGRAASY